VIHIYMHDYLVLMFSMNLMLLAINRRAVPKPLWRCPNEHHPENEEKEEFTVRVPGSKGAQIWTLFRGTRLPNLDSIINAVC